MEVVLVALVEGDDESHLPTLGSQAVDAVVAITVGHGDD